MGIRRFSREFFQICFRLFDGREREKYVTLGEEGESSNSTFLDEEGAPERRGEGSEVGREGGHNEMWWYLAPGYHVPNHV